MIGMVNGWVIEKWIGKRRNFLAKENIVSKGKGEDAGKLGYIWMTSLSMHSLADKTPIRAICMLEASVC